MKRTAVSAAAFLLFCPALHAIELRALAWDQAVAARKLAVADSSETHPLEDLHPLSRSRPVEINLKEDTRLELRALDRTNDEGLNPGVPLDLPAGIRRPLLVLLADPKSPAGVRTFILEDDPADFDWGTIRLLNATGEPLLVKAGDQASAVPPGWKPVDLRPEGPSRNIEVIVALRQDPDKLIYSSVWEHRETHRQLVFLTPQPDRAQGALATKFIVENRLAVEAEDADTDG